jgi:hypothetical protein
VSGEDAIAPADWYCDAGIMMAPPPPDEDDDGAFAPWPKYGFEAVVPAGALIVEG